MTTTQELLDRIRREVSGGRSEPLNKLSAEINASTTTIPLAYAVGGILPAARLGIELEDLYVFESDAANQAAMVQRGYESTTAAIHANGTLVRVNPRFTDAQILRAVNAELRSLWGKGIYRMLSVQLASTEAHAYELPAAVLEVYDVVAQSPAGLSEWVPLGGWAQRRHQDTIDFPSGNSLNFLRDMPGPTMIVNVTYKAELGTLSTLADNVETITGTSAIDLLTIGAALRLGRAREMARNFSETQGSTRRAEEVPPGAEMGANRDLQRSYRNELASERTRLSRLYGQRARR